MTETVIEPLRDLVGRALYEEPGKPDLNWYLLSEERREPWRQDADRCIAVVQMELRERLERAEETATESEKVAPNSYGAGFDRGFATAISEAIDDLDSGSDQQCPQRTATPRTEV